MAEKKVFRFYGKIVTRKFRMRFVKEIIDVDKKGALEKLYSLLGSNHRVKRTQIYIEKIEELKPEEAEDIYIKQLNQIIKEGGW